jgi:hypothetical protein
MSELTSISVVSYASGYSYAIYERFIGSLTNTGFNGTIYIIVKPNDVSVLSQLQENYKNIIICIDNLPQISHINCHRFFVIQQVLNEVQFKSTHLLLCDFRDVLFQKNIELYPYDDSDLYVFTEGIQFTQDKIYNTGWLKQLEHIFNERFYDTICNNSVICCGTTIGKINAIHVYVNAMCNLLSEYNITNNLDQGIHNYLIYLHKLPLNVKILSNKDNLVNTVGCDVHQFNNQNYIVNSNNEISYIVHQYDRFSEENRQKISQKLGFSF